MICYLIQPHIQRCTSITLPQDHTECREAMRKLIGAEVLGYQRVTDGGDTLWLDDMVLMRGMPIFAFRLPTGRDPYGGTSIITPGEYPDGRPFNKPELPLAIVERDIEWLGEILPEVETVIEQGGTVFRQVVTYKRVTKQ